MAEEELVIKEKLSIIINLPHDLNERILSFPVIHLIRDAYPEDDLHLICDHITADILTSLPIKAFYHEWDEEEMGSVFDVHRFAATGKINKADYYFNLASGFKSAILGYFLRAKKRIGFNEGWWAGWLYTLSSHLPTGFHITEKLMLLYKEATHLKIPEEFKIKGKEYAPFYPDDTPSYIVLDLYPFEIGAIDEFWINYINLHEDKTIVLFCSSEIEKGGLLIENLIPRLSSKNKYKHFLNTSWIDLGRVLTRARGYIGRNNAASKFACYLGIDSIIIYEDGNPKIDAPFYFYANWQLMDLSDPTLRVKEQPGLLRKRAQVDPMILFEKSTEAFRF